MCMHDTDLLSRIAEGPGARRIGSVFGALPELETLRARLRATQVAQGSRLHPQFRNPLALRR